MGKNTNKQTLHLWYIIHKGLHLLNICTIYQPVVNNSFNYCIILQSIVDCVSFLDTQQQSYAMAKDLMRWLYNFLNNAIKIKKEGWWGLQVHIYSFLHDFSNLSEFH